MGVLHVVRWLGELLAIGAVAATASADPAPRAAQADAAQLAGCDKRLPKGALSEPIGGDAMYATAGQRRLLVFPAREGRGCVVAEIARAVARTNGKFSGAPRKIFALKASCDGDRCPIAIAMRGTDDRPIAALLTEHTCNHKVALRPVQLFPDRESLELVCQQTAGAGWKERRVLIDAVDDRLIELYSINTGSRIDVAPSEREDGLCPSDPVGSIRVEKVADKPVLRVIDPASGKLHDGAGTLPARQLIYDPAKQSFVPSGAPDVPTAVNAKKRCR